jgi:hypothetical protein
MIHRQKNRFQPAVRYADAPILELSMQGAQCMSANDYASAGRQVPNRQNMTDHQEILMTIRNGTTGGVTGWK